VLGVDADPDMVATATRRQGGDRLRFAVARAQQLDRLVPAGSVDAVFSVAALHWVPAAEHPTVLAQVRRVLRPGGFVRAQFGGRGQIAALRAILDQEALRLGGGPAGWYFPTAEEYADLLAAAGLDTAAGGWVRLLPQRRSFPTAAALAGYLDSQVLGGYDPVLPAAAVPAFRAAAHARARAELRRADGTYDQDFVRLDLLAVAA
jgi:trans-aconitate methyltransferase